MLPLALVAPGYYDAYYLKALHKSLSAKLTQFGAIMMLLAPASPFTALKIGESLKDPLAMYLVDIYSARSISLRSSGNYSLAHGKDSKVSIGIQMIGTASWKEKSPACSTPWNQLPCPFAGRGIHEWNSTKQSWTWSPCRTCKKQNFLVDAPWIWRRAL